MNDRQLIADLLSALEYHTEQTRPIEFSLVAIEAAREYLRKPSQQQEPVAKVIGTAPASKPLTDAQIGAVAADIWGSILIAPQSYQAFARAIEAKLIERNEQGEKNHG